MLIELILMIGGGAAVAGTLRAGASHFAVARAQAAAEPVVATLLRRHRHTRSLPSRYRATNDGLLEMVVAARAARREIVERIQTVLPQPGSRTAYLPALEAQMERVSVSFFETLKTSYLLKVRNLAIGQVADRFDDRLGILRHARHELSGMEQRLVEMLDKVGIIDFAENAFELIPEAFRLYSESAAEAAADGVSNFLHATSTISHVPGLIASGRDAILELQFLIEDRISLGEAFTDGVMPSAIRMVLTKIGAVLDTATGWLSLGFFTIACNWFGKCIGNEILQARLQEQIDIVNGHVEAMRKRQREALAAIRQAVDALVETFNEAIESCPDIGDEPVLKAYIDELLQSYQMGLRQASEATAKGVKRAMLALPKRNWLERLLGIDPANETAALLLDAQRRLESHHLGVAHGFSLAHESHAEHALRFLQTEEIFTSAPTRSALGRQDHVLVQVAEDYAKSLTVWEDYCRSEWEAGTQHIEETTRREHAETRVVVEHAMEEIAQARRRIAILRRRLGAKEMAE